MFSFGLFFVVQLRVLICLHQDLHLIRSFDCSFLWVWPFMSWIGKLFKLGIEEWQHDILMFWVIGSPTEVWSLQREWHYHHLFQFYGRIDKLFPLKFFFFLFLWFALMLWGRHITYQKLAFCNKYWQIFIFWYGMMSTVRFFVWVAEGSMLHTPSVPQRFPQLPFWVVPLSLLHFPFSNTFSLSSPYGSQKDIPMCSNFAFPIK